MSINAIIQLLAAVVQLIHSLINKYEREQHRERMDEIKADPRGAFKRKFTRNRVLTDEERAELNGGVQPANPESSGDARRPPAE